MEQLPQPVQNALRGLRDTIAEDIERKKVLLKLCQALHTEAMSSIEKSEHVDNIRPSVAVAIDAYPAAWMAEAGLCILAIVDLMIDSEDEDHENAGGRA